MSEKKIVIKASDMTESMQQDAIEVSQEALKSYELEKDVAASIKKEFDKRHGASWHCVVGRSFGSYITHESKHFIYFYIDQIAVLLFKSG
jgi:dynein light chain LC8-type